MKELVLRFIGESPLLMHSDRGANIQDPGAKAHKALTSKRLKTDDDHYEIARSEFMLALYMNNKGPIMPTTNIRSCLIAGARLSKLGKKLERGMLILEDHVALQFDGPKTAKALWDAGSKYVDMRGVVVAGKRIMRCRPRFAPPWSFETAIQYDETQVEEREILKSAADGGRYVGLLDYRVACKGTMGRFSVEMVQ